MTRAPASVASDVARRLRQRDRSPWVVGLAVALVVALVALAVVTWQWRADVRTHQAETDARTTAEERTTQLLTWTASTLDADAAWADDGATADFRTDYDVILDGLRDTYGALGASSTGTVLASSPRATSADQVEVTLFARQSVARASAEAPTCVLSSIVLTMVRDDGAWLVDHLEAPGDPVQVPC
ncbi:hypothetical protein [Aeromicrobium alkaliterrae]|uniref:Mce-associated membrane protein n=1 Tax=Aeromicrobium alkaliterrae TaxID=302168 RepID=A0ABN2JH33_9ACTN